MKPFTRELINDRRQPALRWGAVFAGVAVAVALWSILQMLGMGIGLTAIDVDDAGSLRHVSIGNGVWSMIVPLIALFVGGMIAGKLAATLDERTGAMHGFVVGALAVVTGLVMLACLGAILGGSSAGRHGWMMSEHMMVAPSLRAAERAEAAKEAGKVLLGAGVAMLIGMGGAVAGGALATRKYKRKKHDTAEVPVVPPPAAPPTDAPHVG